MKRTLFITTVLFLMLVAGLAACRGGAPEEASPAPIDAGDTAAGEKVYARACVTCHGSKGEGVPGMSKDMTQSELIAGKTNQELVEFIKLGGAPGEALVMLPKAGNPALSDANLYDVVAYLRTLQEQAIRLGQGKD
jgi:mono/diheme cytochrome c family protein